MKLNARQLRTTPMDVEKATHMKKNPIFIILDNVLDTYNIGALFRLADAVAVQCVYLCGETQTPPNSKIKKSSVNTWMWVEWEYCATAQQAIAKLKIQNPNVKIIAVEQDDKSIPYYEAQYQFPLAIVVGNETSGVSKEVLEMADGIVEIPMWGVNKSLNVMVSCGIVLFEAMKHITEKNAYA